MAKPDLIKWVPDDDAAKITDPGTTKKNNGWLYEEPPPFQFFNWIINRVSKWLLGLQGSYYDVVVGSTAQVTSNDATHVVGDLDDTLVVAGTRVMILDGTHTLAANLTLTNDDVQIAIESQEAIVDLSTFAITISGARAHVTLRATNVDIGDITITGAGSYLCSYGFNGSLVTSGDGVVVVANDTLSGIYVNGFSVVTDEEIVQRAIVPIVTSNWTEYANPRDGDLNAAAWSEDLFLFCAVGDAVVAPDAYIATSDDGVHWFAQSNPKQFQLNDIVWVKELSLYVAVGDGDGTDAYIVTSPDGLTWTERANPKNVALRGIGWSKEQTLLVAVGDADGTDAYMVTSPDGITWTERANPKNIGLRGVAFSPELTLWVAVGLFETAADAYLVTSPDGLTWTERATNNNESLRAVIWVSELGKFIAVGSADVTSPHIETSPDGLTWTQQFANRPQSFNDIVWAPELGVMMAVGSSVGGPQDMTHASSSPDGITWTFRPFPYGTAIEGLDWSPFLGCFVAVGLNDTSNDAGLLKSLNATF